MENFIIDKNLIRNEVEIFQTVSKYYPNYLQIYELKE